MDVINEPSELSPFKEMLESLPTAKLRDAIYGLAVGDKVPDRFRA